MGAGGVGKGVREEGLRMGDCGGREEGGGDLLG